MKTKKLLSWLISGSMLVSALPMTTANAAEEYISVTVNPVDNGFYNVDRGYTTSGGSGIIEYTTSTTYTDSVQGEDGNYTRTQTKKTEYLSINAESFSELDLWKTSWTDIVTDDSKKSWVNTLTFEGVDYEIGIPFNNKNFYTGTGVNTIANTYSSYSGDGTTNPYYRTYDIEDGYYKGVSFIGGAYNSNKPYIRYVYDGNIKSNWVQLNAPNINPKSADTTVAHIELESNLYSRTVETIQTSSDNNSWSNGTKTTTDDNASDNVGNAPKFYLYKIDEMSIDSTKELLAIEFIARNGEVNTEDLSQEPYAGSNKYKYGFVFAGMTMLSDDTCEANSKISEMKTILDTLPPAEIYEATTENAALLERLTELVDEIDPALLDDTAAEVYYEALEYTQYEFETGYTSVTQNLYEKGWTNRDRVYCTSGGSSLFETKVYDTDGTTQIGTQYHAVYAKDFLALSNWKEDWAKIEQNAFKDAYGYKKNIFTFNGIDYEISVPFKTADDTVYESDGFHSMVATETYAGSEGNPYYVTYDIDDGYYKGVSFFGASIASKPYIRYVYSDGTKSNWSNLSAAKGYTSAVAEGDKYLTVKANTWQRMTDSSTSVNMVSGETTFNLHQMTDETADINKKTTAIEVIARNAELPKTDGVVDVTAEPIASTNSWNYRLCFIGMTLLTNNAGKSNAAVEEMNAILAELPEVVDGTNAEDLELIAELKTVLEDVIPEILSETDLANYNLAKEYAKLAELVGDEYVTVEPASFVNSSNAYYIGGTAANQGNAYSGTAIYAPDFKVMNIWDNEWTADMTENILTFNGYKYKLRVTEEKGVQVTVSANQATSADDAYIRIPVEAGYYNGLSLLGGLEYNGSAGAVRLNYADGTSSGFIAIEDIKKMNTGDGLSVTRYGFSATSEDGKTGIYVDNGDVILHQYNIAVDGSKLLSSFDLVARNAVIENGVVTSVEDSLRTYNTRWFGFGLKSNGILAENAKDVVVKVNPDIFVNYNRTYMKNCGSAGISNNHAIDWEGFITLSNWKNTWSDSTGVEDNIFVTDKAEYLVRMDRGTQKNNTFGAQSGTEVGYTTIDIDDGYFTKMMLLGGATQHGATGIAMQFNYSDGTSSGFLTQGTGGNITASGDGAIEVVGLKSTKGSDGTYTYESTKLYLREYEFVNPNAYKKVVSVSIPYRNVTIADGVLTPMSSTGGSGAYAYDNRFIGMSMITNKVMQDYEVVDNSTDAISITVSPDGSDNNDGVEAPVKTFAQAIAKAKAINSISTYDRDVVITLADGEYEVTETVSIDSFRGNVTIKAADGASPVIKGSKTLNISDMSDYTEADIDGIKYVSLADYGITSIKNDSIISSNNSIMATNNFGVFSEGEILPIAEYPNNGEMSEEAAINTKAGDTISIENENFLYYADENLYLEGYLVENYRTYKTNSFTIDGSVLTIDSSKLPARTMYGLTRNWRIFNSLALLDTEGEWYLDKAAMTLYYLPKSGETSVEISNMTDALIKIAMDNVTIEGISFKNTCGTAIGASDVSGLTVKDSSFEAIGKNAITASNVNDALISENIITNIGYKGVAVSGGDVKTLKESGNVIEANTITKPGRVVRCYSQAVEVSGVGNVVKNNYLADSKSILVSFGGSLNKIMYNDIVNAGSEAKDLGAVYGGRNLTYLGNEISYNHIVNPVSEDSTDDVVAGIYLDDGLSGTNVHHNVIENADRGVFTNGGSQNTVNNNVFINCISGIRTGANPINGFTVDYDSDNTGVTLTKYAELYFAANPAYAENFAGLDLTKLTVDAAEFKASAAVSGNRFMDCTENWVNAAYGNGTEADTSDDVYAEVAGDDNVAVSAVLEGLAEADIDTNDIGIAEEGLDTEIAWAEIENGTVTVNYVSTYADYKVMAAVKDGQGKLLAVKTVSDGESFTVENAAEVDIFVFDSLNNLKPMTK